MSYTLTSYDGNRAAQAFIQDDGWHVVLTYGGSPGRRLRGLDEDVALHVAQRWARAGHLPEDPYVSDSEFKRQAGKRSAAA